MRQVSENVFTEIYFRGCNPSFLRTSEGTVLIDTPMRAIDSVRWRERALEHGRPRYIINTEPHRDHTLGNAYFPEAEVVAHVRTKERFAHYHNVPQTLAERIELAKTDDPESVHLLQSPEFPPRPPTKTFTDTLTLTLGRHTIRLIHTPGHTDAQTTVHVPEERVAFVGDNIFSGSRTWLQEADPWEWLTSLDRIAQLDVDVIIPGHGEPVTKAYLAIQKDIVSRWIDTVEGFVARGVTVEEALRGALSIAEIDPYPMDLGGFARGDYVIDVSARNLFRRVGERRTAIPIAGLVA